MPSRNLTVRQRIIDLRNETGLPFSTIAETINEEFNLQGEDKITKDAAQKTYKAHAWMKTLMSKIEDEPEGPAAAIVKKGESVFVQTKGHVPEPEEDAEPEHESPADRFRREFDDRWDSSRADPEPRNPGNYRKVVVCGDWHGNPNKTALQGIIDEDPDVIVLAGDLLNCEQASQHTDDAESLGRLMKDEIGNSRGGIQILSEQTRASILAMHGNHDKWIKRLLKAAGMEWLLSIWPGPLELITRDIPRVEIVNTQTMFHLPDGNAELFAQTQFMLPLGDAVISHLNFTGKHPGAAVLKLSEWMYEWHRVLGIPEPRLLVQLHVHKTADLDKQSGHLRLIEPGMIGAPSDEWYKMGYQPKWTPGSLGFMAFEQVWTGDDWETVLNSIKVIRIGR